MQFIFSNRLQKLLLLLRIVIQIITNNCLLSVIIMRYTAPSADLFIRNRKKFSAKMQANTAAIFFANPMLPTNADGTYRFTQNSNLYYLSGIDQEDVILFLFPDAPKESLKEILFIKKTNATIQTWEGWKYSVEEAQQASGIQNVQYVEDFMPVILQTISLYEGIYLEFNEHDRNVLHLHTEAHEFANMLAKRFPAHKIHRAWHLLRDLRMIKEPEEVVQIQTACNITEKAFRRVLNFVRPGVYEYEIEAEILHEFIRNRATGPAYDSIIATGKNACVLHYVLNRDACKAGDLLLMDFGAEYGNYSADLTRTIPVDGKFTTRQKDIYNAVLRAMRFAVSKLVPGNNLETYNQEVGLFLQEELLTLGLLTQEEVKNAPESTPAYRKYFMHGTSHHLGLDTHDVSLRYKTFEPGMVFTCEPGLYIPEENIGIRIENDYLLTETTPIDLMANIPIEVEEIEALMLSRKA